MLRANWLCLVIFSLPVFAVEIPAGAELHIRLLDKVGTTVSKPKQAVRAVLIAPVVQDNQIVIPAGADVTGTVKTAQAAAQASERSVLELEFTSIDLPGDKEKLSAKVASVDNARETVDDAGRILGIVAGETFAARIDQGIGKVAGRYAGLADMLKAAKEVVGVKEAEGDISYESGAEMTLKLTQPLQVRKPSEGDAAKLRPFPSEAEIIDMVTAQPFRTLAANPPRPSDITNIMFIGTQERARESVHRGWLVHRRRTERTIQTRDGARDYRRAGLQGSPCFGAAPRRPAARPGMAKAE